MIHLLQPLMALFDRFFKKTLYFPGCSAKFMAKEVSSRHEKILTKIGIKYVKIPEIEVCCGKPALEYGYVEDFKTLVQTNIDNFKAQEIKKIITSCPCCYSIMKQHYDEFEVEHISQTILDNINKFDKKGEGEQVTYFDSCNPQKLSELYETPRKVLEKLGYRIIELEYNKEKSLSCGESLKLVSSKIAKAMSEAVLNETKTKKFITMSPSCYLHFKENNPKNVKIIELSEVVI